VDILYNLLTPIGVSLPGDVKVSTGREELLTQRSGDLITKSTINAKPFYQNNTPAFAAAAC